jgi:hypothetical protein
MADSRQAGIAGDHPPNTRLSKELKLGLSVVLGVAAWHLIAFGSMYLGAGLGRFVTLVLLVVVVCPLFPGVFFALVLTPHHGASVPLSFACNVVFYLILAFVIAHYHANTRL